MLSHCPFALWPELEFFVWLVYTAHEGTIWIFGSKPLHILFLLYSQVQSSPSILLRLFAHGTYEIFIKEIETLIYFDELGALLISKSPVHDCNVALARHWQLSCVYTIEAKFGAAHEMQVVFVRVVEALFSSLPVCFDSSKEWWSFLLYQYAIENWERQESEKEMNK